MSSPSALPSRVTRPRRITLEPTATLGLPLTILQTNAPAKRDAEPFGTDGTHISEVTFRSLGVVLTLAGFRRGKPDAPATFASPAVGELLAILVQRYLVAGRPANGRVHFRQREVAEELGIVAPGARSVPGQVWQQLKHLLRHLQHTTIDREPLDVDDGSGEVREGATISSLSFLGSFELRPEPAGRPSPNKPRPAPQSWVQLDSRFLELLAGDDVVAFDLDALQAVGSRLGRVLFRVLAYYSRRGEQVVRAAELLERLGSTLGRPTLGRVRDLLDRPHRELCEARVLREEPQYGRDAEGAVTIRYAWGRHALLGEGDEWLIRTCAGYGLSRATTVMLLDRDRDRLYQGICALYNGDLSPRIPAAFLRRLVEDGWQLSTAQIPSERTRWSGWRAHQPITREVYDDWYRASRSLGLRNARIIWGDLHAQARERLAGVYIDNPSMQQISQEVEEIIRRALRLPTWEEFQREPETWLKRPMTTEPFDLSMTPHALRRLADDHERGRHLHQ